MPCARLQVYDNDALSNLDVPQLTSTGGDFEVRAGRTHRPELGDATTSRISTATPLAIAFADGAPRAGPQVYGNDALTNLDVRRLTSTAGDFYVRAGQTHSPELGDVQGSTISTATPLCQRLYRRRATRSPGGRRTHQPGRATAHFHGRRLLRARRPHAQP